MKLKECPRSKCQYTGVHICLYEWKLESQNSSNCQGIWDSWKMIYHSWNEAVNKWCTSDACEPVGYQYSHVCAHQWCNSVHLCVCALVVNQCAPASVHWRRTSVHLCVQILVSIYLKIIFGGLFYKTYLSFFTENQESCWRLADTTWSVGCLFKLQRVEHMIDGLNRGIYSKEHWYKTAQTPVQTEAADWVANESLCLLGSWLQDVVCLWKQAYLSFVPHLPSCFSHPLKRDFWLSKPALEKHVIPITLHCSEILDIFNESGQIVGLGL